MRGLGSTPLWSCRRSLTLEAVSIRVLIVDDDIVFRDAIAAVLIERGYDVAATVGSLSDALAALETLDPDAVLLDIHLPDGNGLSFVESLPGDGRRPRVLLTSSDAHAAPARLVKRSRAAGFVAKTDLLTEDLSRY